MTRKNIIDIGLGLILIWLVIGVMRINKPTDNQNVISANDKDLKRIKVENKAWEGKIQLLPANQDLKVNQNFDMEVLVDTGGKNLGAFNMYLDFDPTQITIDTSRGIDTKSDTGKGFDKGLDTVDYTMMSNSDDIDKGHFRFAGITASGYANGKDKHLIVIHAKAIKAGNTKNLSLRVNELSDELGHPLKGDENK